MLCFEYVSKGQQWPLAARIRNGSGNGNGNVNGINNGRKTRRPNQKLIKIMSASTAACDRRGLTQETLAVKKRQRHRDRARARERERETEIRRERKNKPNNNIYDYFYEVLTNFYEFLMGPLHLCVFVIPLLLLLLQTEGKEREYRERESVRE